MLPAAERTIALQEESSDNSLKQVPISLGGEKKTLLKTLDLQLTFK